MSEMAIWFFTSQDYTVTFEETSPDKLPRAAFIDATLCELNKPSHQTVKTPRIYRIEEGKSIAKSLVGKPVFFGITWKGSHRYNERVGVVTDKVRQVGNKIKGVIKVTSKKIIGMLKEYLKEGKKFLFSIAGVANSFAETVKKGKIVHVLYGVLCTSLQMLPWGTPVGFPSAQMERLIRVEETTWICGDDACACPILKCVPRITEDIVIKRFISDDEERIITEITTTKVNVCE